MIEYNVEERACKDCKWREGNKCTCKYRGRDSIGRLCINAARKEYVGEMKGTILEVGPGANSFIRKLVTQSKDLEYIKYKGHVSDIEQDDDSVDIVVAGQCMEHWHEKGDSLDEGIEEVHRILKPGGIFFIDVPIHSHGHPIFIEGNIEEIMEEFDEHDWEVVKVEKRREDYEPLEPIPVADNAPEGSVNYLLVIILRKK